MIHILLITRITLLVLSLVSAVVIARYVVNQARKTKDEIRKTLVMLNNAVPSDKCDILQKLGMPCDLKYKEQEQEFRLLLQKAELDYHDVSNLASALNLSRYDSIRVYNQRS